MQEHLLRSRVERDAPQGRLQPARRYMLGDVAACGGQAHRDQQRVATAGDVAGVDGIVLAPHRKRGAAPSVAS